MALDETVPQVSRNRPRRVEGHLGDSWGHFRNNDENTPKPQIDGSRGTVRTVGTLTPAKRDKQCRGRWGDWQCTATLDVHNITGLCRECKLILRNERATGVAADPRDFVTPEQAAANIAQALTP